MNKTKELLTSNKIQELFDVNHQFINYFDYDNWACNDGKKITKSDDLIYRNFRNILKKDARFNNYYELVAVVSLTVCSYPYDRSPFRGQVIRNPRYVKPNTNFLGQTGYAGTVVCRDKKTGKILQVPQRWLFVTTRTCINAELSIDSGLPGLADLICAEVFCGDYETYEKLMRIQVLERHR